MEYSEHTEVSDSLSQTTPSANIGNLPDDVLGATLVSFGVLIVAYLSKYISLGLSFKNLWEAIKEFPVDANTIVITVLVSFYYKVHTINNLISLVVYLIICVIFCAIIRAIISKISDRDDYNGWWGTLNVVLLFVEYAIPISSTLLIVNKYL